MQKSPSTNELRERYYRVLKAEQERRKAEAHKFDWLANARPNQIAPPEPWTTWLILAGRGFGKTRTGAEQVRIWVKKYPFVNLIGATSDDARDIMIEGESGILAICPRDERPRYLSQKRQLLWPNGAKSLIFTADEPERLRGKQHMKLWADEFCAWRYPDAWDQAAFGLRLGDNPQAIVTTTPKPTKALKELKADPGTVVTTGSTYDNQGNLAPTFLTKIVRKYEGTRLGRQELNAEILDDNPGALWKRKQIDDLRVSKAPSMRRIVIAIDPAAKKNPNSDETGITAEGMGFEGHGYLLADLSMRGTPEEWGRAAVNAYYEFKADRIVAEVNNGGDMVEHVIRSIDKNIPFTAVHASRGKITRAEPISALYEQGRIHHVGCFPVLEDQMCEYDPKTADWSPDRMDSAVWGFTELFGNDNEIRIRRL
ncbi:DNA-packaging protein [Tundrisphaera lichenicola]|uniref:DNA-packaging protein n=1 Tax=Tundrisphaera lichenicola TaxID=2029860 RepID=UPI003EBDC05A